MYWSSEWNQSGIEYYTITQCSGGVYREYITPGVYTPSLDVFPVHPDSTLCYGFILHSNFQNNFLKSNFFSMLFLLKNSVNWSRSSLSQRSVTEDAQASNTRRPMSFKNQIADSFHAFSVCIMDYFYN